MNVSKFRGLILTGCSLLLASGAEASNQASTTFGVSATVQSSCSVSANNVGFGTVNVLAGSNTDTTTTISVTCTNGTAYNIGLDAGGGSGATTSSRKMTGASNGGSLNYALYSDGGFLNNWGNVVGTDTVSGTADGSSHSVTVYARIPSGQTSAAADSYSDTINVTVTY